MGVPEESVYLRLKSSTDVGAICGDRIYPLRAPSTAVAAAVSSTAGAFVRYQRISGVYDVSHQDRGPQYQRARVQVDSYSGDFDQAGALAREVRKRLASYRGSTAGVQVWAMTLDSDSHTDEGEEGDDRLYRVRQDWFVETRVSTATPWDDGFDEGFGG